MTRMKVTLSLDEGLVKRVKSKLALEGKTLSGTIERLLANLDHIRFLNSLTEALSLERGIYSFKEVMVDRPMGLDAGAVVRELRDEREKSISRH
jgi:hypothetical protein